ncbi:hypothetical protein KPH14_000872, partial [Odynerus spinipes]
MFNGVLEVPLPEGVTIIAYADDLALLVEASTAHQLGQRA